MQGAIIRKGTKKDLPMLRTMARAAWPDWWKKNALFGTRYLKDRIKSGHLLVSTANSEITGYLIYGSLWSRHMHLEDVYLKPKYRRLGLGAELMNRLIAIAKKNGARKIVLEVDPKNKISCKYSIKHGFKKAGHVKRLWGNTDALVFIKDIW
jgi:ribosomal-protein-alanine N-acetyltransferase